MSRLRAALGAAGRILSDGIASLKDSPRYASLALVENKIIYNLLN